MSARAVHGRAVNSHGGQSDSDVSISAALLQLWLCFGGSGEVPAVPAGTVLLCQPLSRCRLEPFGVEEQGFVVNPIKVDCMSRWERSFRERPWGHLSLAVMRDAQPRLRHRCFLFPDTSQVGVGAPGVPLSPTAPLMFLLH